MTKLFDVVQEGHPGEKSIDTATILTYEVGDLMKMLVYSGLYPERKRAYMIEGKISMMDVITQCQIICDREGWDFNELKRIGSERAIERITRRVEKGE